MESRIEGGETIGGILNPLEEEFDFKDPIRMHSSRLLKAYELVKQIEDEHWRTIKTQAVRTTYYSLWRYYI